MAARVLRRAGARRAFSAEPAPAYASERINAATAPTLMEIGCRDIFDEDHDAFRQMCRDFFANEVKPFHKEWEKAGEVPRELWTKAGDLGLDIVAPYITNYGTEEQKQRILPKLVSGEWIGALGMTEPSAGSDFANIKTTAVKDGDDYVINGSKVFITNGWMADVTIVCAKTDASKAPRRARLIADMGVSAAEAVFEWTRDYTMDRSAFKGKLSNLQVVGHKLAEMKTDICVGRAFVDNCIALHSQHKLDSVQASMAKYWCTDLQCKIADAGVQLHGGWGYMLISRSITNPRH
ncbi:isovaleryl-CoA dehydrogenase [Aureococcus anophagefferens]|nr:isovaleryl-CoA dehydrogenase [Aureococcus anophagefferens]